MSCAISPRNPESFRTTSSHLTLKNKSSTSALAALFEHKMQNLKREKKAHKALSKPSVLIVGAGPAGLIRAIQSILNGSRTTILEKRSECAPSRRNTVALEKETVSILKKYGIYEYLLKEGLIYPENKTGINVAIGDLEKALRAVLAHLTKKPLIQYESEVSQMHTKTNTNATITITKKSGEREDRQPDILVIADGARSSTSKLLGIDRSQVLPMVPVVAAIFKDDRPAVRSVKDGIAYLRLTAHHTAKRTYYTVLFLFKLAFQKEHPFSRARKIGGSLILKTPDHHYLGYGLNREMSAKLAKLAEQVTACQQKLDETKKSGNPLEQVKCAEALKQAIEKRDRYVEHWAYLSFCFANLIELLRSTFGLLSKEWIRPNFAFWKPLDLQNTAIFDIKTDHANLFSLSAANTAVFLAGDASATVDPATGLGCNTALISSSYYQLALNELEEHTSKNEIFSNYNQYMHNRINYIHHESRRVRKDYRPDAI